MTTKTHREIQVIANYSILYDRSFDVYCPFTDITVNIIALLTPDDVMQVMFELPRYTTPCASFMVNNKKCQDICVASMTDYGDHAILRFADDVGNEVLMIRDYDSTVQIRYDYCEQPMSAITCRFRQTADLLLCLGVGKNNVSRVLNETLKYAGARKSLSSTEIQEITIILNNSANLDSLRAEDARNILLNIDCILSADSKNIKDGKSAGTLLSLLPTLVQHTNASQFDFLYGENFGFTARSIDCSSPTNNGLLDFGDIFKIFTGSMPLGDQHNSIYISIAEICRQQEVSHVYLAIYRDRKLFIGSKQYHLYDSGFTVAQEGAHFAINAKLSDGQARGSDSETEDDVPSRCTRQIALPTESPVMSGTVLNNEKILSPLHGRFRVTWWDTKKLEWSTRDQCETTTKSDTVVARCQHLTDFTLIVDGKLDDPNVCDTTLMYLGYIASTLSVVSLTFLILMNVCTWPPLLSHRTFRYLRGSSPPHTDFVSLAHKIALLLFYVVFTIFSGRSVSGKACQFGAFDSFPSDSTHIHVLRHPSDHPVLPFTSSILLLVLTRFFNRGDCFCWVRPDYVVYAVIIPVSFLVLNATVCTFLVCRRLFGTSRTLGKSIRYTDQYLCSKIVAVVLMQVSLGMPWILQYFTLYAPYTTVWHYIFTIVMGSQGTMLVLLFLYKRSRSMPSDKRSQQSRITLTRDGTPSSRS
uniref:GPS domain-containing protein n=1 Tax=Angiostrongylus cantonensis TaxID=6313 RepID=A0A0K0CT74_ANGCA